MKKLGSRKHHGSIFDPENVENIGDLMLFGWYLEGLHGGLSGR